MHLFFDPSVLPVTTIDGDGNILYIRTHGLYHYGYPDLILENPAEDGEELILDILDRIFRLDFNVSSVWNYNGRLLRLELCGDGLARILFTTIEDEARILSLINPLTGQPTKFITKGLKDLFNHPEVEVSGETLYGREILGYVMEQIKSGTEYNQDTTISLDENVYSVHQTSDRYGSEVIRIQLDDIPTLNKPRTHKSKMKSSHLHRVK